MLSSPVIDSMILNFSGKFFTVGGQEKYFLVKIWISICRNRTCKKFENRSTDNIFIAEINLHLQGR